MQLRNPETRVAAGRLFKKMFLEKFQRHLDTMPPCYRLGETSGTHPLSRLRENAEAAMPWKGLGQQPKLGYISIGKDTDGRLYSEKEFRVVMERTMDKDPPVIYFLIPCSQNPESWDAVIVSSEKEERRAVHVVFLKTMTQPEHTQHQIIAKGLNQVRDAVPKTWDCEGRNVHYHYVLVLLTHDNEESDIPQWRHVLISSKEQ